jgi:hypothetical protein
MRKLVTHRALFEVPNDDIFVFGATHYNMIRIGNSNCCYGSIVFNQDLISIEIKKSLYYILEKRGKCESKYLNELSSGQFPYLAAVIFTACDYIVRVMSEYAFGNFLRMIYGSNHFGLAQSPNFSSIIT